MRARPARQRARRPVGPRQPRQRTAMPAMSEEPQSQIDLTADPIVQQVQALQMQNVAAAQASFEAQKQRALMQFGYDPALAGQYGSAANEQAARNNPFSTSANLARQHTERQHNLNENLNKGN